MSFTIAMPVHLRMQQHVVFSIVGWGPENQLPQELQNVRRSIFWEPEGYHVPLSMSLFSIEETKLYLSYGQYQKGHYLMLVRERQRRQKLKTAQLQLKDLRKKEYVRQQLDKNIPKTILQTFSSTDEGRRLYNLIDALEEEIAWLKYDKTAPKRPLVPRKRALSLTNSKFDPEESQISQQDQSPMFRLPLELRQNIYRRLFGNLLIDINMTHGGKNGPPGSENRRIFDSSTIWQNGIKIKSATSMSKENQRLHEYAAREFNSKVEYLPQEELEYLSILPVLQSCRRVYSESIKILYEENAFNLVESHQAYQLPRYLPEKKVTYIRQINFALDLARDWFMLADTLSQLNVFTNLRSLLIRCRLGHCLDINIVNEQSLLKSVNSIPETVWQNDGWLFQAALRRLDPCVSTVILLPISYDVLGGILDLGNVKIVPFGPVSEQDVMPRKGYARMCEAYLRQTTQVGKKMPWSFMNEDGTHAFRFSIN